MDFNVILKKKVAEKCRPRIKWWLLYRPMKTDFTLKVIIFRLTPRLLRMLGIELSRQSLRQAGEFLAFPEEDVSSTGRHGGGMTRCRR